MKISQQSIHSLFQKGYAMPMVILTTGLVMVIMLSVLQNALSVKISLDDQYYTMLAKESSEAGLVKAVGCYKGGTTNWTTLKPEDSCLGSSGNGGGGGGGSVTSPPQFVSHTSGTNYAEFTVTANKPVGLVAGNLVLCGISTTDQTITAQAGWTQVAASPNSYESEYYVFGRVLDGTEGTSFTFTGNVSWRQRVAHCVGIAGQHNNYVHSVAVNGSNGWNVTPTSNAATSISKTLLIGFQGSCCSSNNSSTPPTGMTELSDSNSDGNWSQGAIAYKTLLNASNEALSWTLASNANWSTVAIAIAPKPSSGGGGGGGGGPTVPADWYDAQFLTRKKITFANAASTENLTNFPVKVTFNSSNIDYTKTKNAGEDIRFTDSDGRTLLSHEIERWNEAGNSEVWVKVPQIDAGSNTDYIYVYYNNSTAADGQNRADVWSNNYRSVWHLSESPTGASPQFKDSTSNNNHGTAQGGMTSGQSIAGVIGNGVQLDGSNDYISTASLINNPQNLTIETWFHTSSAAGRKIVGFERSQTGSSTNYDRHLWIGTDGILRSGANDGTADIAMGTATRHNSTWHYAAATIDDANNNLRLYENGTLSRTIANNNAEIFNGYWRIGAFRLGGWPQGGDGYFPGRVDEVRISSAVRSASWINAQYRSMGSSFNTFGSAVNVDGTVMGVATGSNAPNSVIKGPNFIATFNVNPPEVNSDNVLSITSTGTVNLFNANGVFKTYKQVAKRTVVNGSWTTVVTKNRMHAGENSYVIAPDKAIYGAGRNNLGQLGNLNTVNQSTPVRFQLPAGVTAKYIGANDNATLVVGSDGNVYGVGNNTAGELGDGTTINRTTPVRFNLPVNERAIAVDIEDSNNNNTTWVLTESGNVYGVGENSFGQLGVGHFNDTTAVVRMNMPTGGVTFRAMSVDGPHITFMGTDNQVYGVGANWVGQLGSGAFGNTATIQKFQLPAGLTAKSWQADDENTYVLASDNRVYGAGANNFGQLGIGSSGTNFATPQLFNLPAGVTAKSMVMDGGLTIVIGSDGNAYMAGRNDFGAIGNNTRIHVASPIRYAIPAGKTVIDAGTSSYYVHVITADKEIWGSGTNWNGNIGDGTTAERLVPVRTQWPSSVTPIAITSGAENPYVLTDTGEMWGWGNNVDGRLGNGAMNYDQLTPVKFNFTSSATQIQATSINY